MTVRAEEIGSFRRTVLDNSAHARRYVIVAAVALGLAIYMPDPAIGLGLFFFGLIFLALAAMARFAKLRHDAQVLRTDAVLRDFLEDDASICLIEAPDGSLVFRNAAARENHGEAVRDFSQLCDQIAPMQKPVIRTMREQVQTGRLPRNDLALRNGAVRVSARPMSGGKILWRFEEIAERAATGRSIDSLSVAMMVISKAGTVMYMNEALRRLVGGRPTHLDKVVNDLPLSHDGIHHLAGKDGPLLVRTTVVDGALGRREVFFAPIEARPLDADARWSDIEQLPVALLRIDTGGLILASNAMARKLLSIGADEAPHFSDLVEGLGRSVTGWLAGAAEGRPSGGSEFVKATRHTQEVYLQVSLAASSGRDQPEIVAVITDATELKSLEAQFVQSQKMQAIGQLAGGIAHDFNNLLTAISGHCDLLMLRHEESDPDYSDLIQIHQNANRAASLVGQLLAFSRKQTLKPEMLNVTDALDDLAHLLGRLVGEKITLDSELSPDLPFIRADKRQLEQVIMNLVVNARDAMPDGGTIKVETALETLSEPYRRDNATVPPGTYVVIQVSDQGSGIPQDRIQKIFEPFFTTKRTGEGTGLGLSMAYGIVKQTGGFIFVDSAVGVGTRFSLFFPAYDRVEKPVLPTQPEAPHHALHDGTGVVLLVEDEAPVRAFASRALRMRGYQVLEADSAEKALETLEDPALEVDVFVTDVIMPGRDGPSWVSEALQKRPETRVVFISGYAEDSIAEHQARIPNSVFLPKPFSLSELAATVGRQI